MTAGIAVFVKTPGLSPLKTRLAAGTDPAFALAWYERAAFAVAQTAQVPNAQVYWAVAESAGLTASLWQHLPRLAQCQNPADDLGARMFFVMQSLLTDHNAGILLGADTPHFAPAIITDVMAWLDSPQPRQALARAHDGGFWLYGANGLAPKALWQSVIYSRANTATAFAAAFAQVGEFKAFPMAQDVDIAEDLAICLDALQQLSKPTPAQTQLQLWMRQHMQS
jgi:uncharacterized protein